MSAEALAQRPDAARRHIVGNHLAPVLVARCDRPEPGPHLEYAVTEMCAAELRDPREIVRRALAGELEVGVVVTLLLEEGGGLRMDVADGRRGSQAAHGRQTSEPACARPVAR